MPTRGIRTFAGLLGVWVFVALFTADATWARHSNRGGDRVFNTPPKSFAEGADPRDAYAPNCSSSPLKNDNGGKPDNIEGNNNAEVLQWKVTSKNQFLARARVQGKIVKIYPDRNGHEHFSIQIGPQPTDTVEIVYNHAFGNVSDPSIGMDVEACGDYITSTGPAPAPGGKTYPASPDGAIVHWVHRAPSRSGHRSGFLIINGILTGQNDPAHLLFF